MTLTYKQIDNNTGEKFFKNFSAEKTFLQSINFKEFRKNLGEEVFLYGIFKEETQIGMCLIQKIKTKLKTFLHIPHGPLFIKINEDIKNNIWENFLEFYKDFGKKEKCDFVRISPLLEENVKNLKILKKQKFRNASIHLVNPERTWVLDITKDSVEILKEMKKSTRYEVNKGLKNNLKIQIGNSKEDLDIFWKLHVETVKRQGFTPFPRSSTEIELKAFGNDVQIISVFHESKAIASGIFIFDDQNVYYHQGASIYSKMPGAHSYIWAALLEAQKRGCKNFNFWGICNEKETKHPWFGLSKFKRGFGGEEKVFIHAQDFPLTYKYWISAGIEKYRKWKKRY